MKRFFLHALLAVCVGLLPAMNSYAGDIGGQHDMTTGYPACADGQTGMPMSCDGPGCIAMAGTCGLAAAVLPGVLTQGRVRLQASVQDPGRVRFRSHLDVYIYRPPIA